MNVVLTSFRKLQDKRSEFTTVTAINVIIYVALQEGVFMFFFCFKAAENKEQLTKLRDGTFLSQSNTVYVKLYAIQYINQIEHHK